MAQLIRWLVRGAILVFLIFCGREIIEQVTSWLDMSLLPHTEDMLHRAIIIGLTIYVVLMALPFVPGAEIGLALMTALGGAIAPLVYLATAASLIIAYTIGRLLPPSVLRRGLAALGLTRADAFVDEAAAMTAEDLQAKLEAMSDNKVIRVLLRYRYMALLLAINTPGNVVLGGGGGIAMMAGLSRLFAPLPFVLTVLIAILPVPLLFYASTM